MNYQTKKLLLDTIDFYRLVPINERQSKIDTLKDKLALEHSLNAFFDIAPEYLQAAKIFLRIEKYIN